ncbi:MAG: DUF1573 domain-containing protein [Ignavibacteriae bacterium]|nr:DUF1573 domain-containing protein [Ignavibacteriota bacterium]
MKYLVLSIVLLSFILSNNSYAQPKLEIVGGDTYNWNKVKPKDTPLNAKIQLKNAGTDTLVISNVKPGCGCTTAPLDKSKLGPNEVGTLDVKLNISNRPGAVTKTIAITSNDPKTPNSTLFLKADVQVDIEVSPQYFTFNDMKVGQESVSKVKIINHSNQNVTFSDFNMTPETASYNISKSFVLKPNEEMEIVERAKPTQKGYFSSTLKMKTSHQDFQELIISGYGPVAESPIFNNSGK